MDERCHVSLYGVFDAVSVMNPRPSTSTPNAPISTACSSAVEYGVVYDGENVTATPVSSRRHAAES